MLTTRRWWPTTTLADYLDLENVSEDEAYKAMDWLQPRQPAIEIALSKRHLKAGDPVFYDLSSSYLEGTPSHLARYGSSRDKQRGQLKINYGLMADRDGRPIGIELYPGNQSDSTTFTPMVEKVRRDFGLSKIIFVGDRHLLGAKNIQVLREMEGVEWILTLKSVSIQALVEDNDTWRSLSDGVNWLEIVAPDGYPGERLIVGGNPLLAKRGQDNRHSLLDKTDQILEEIKERVTAGRLKGEGAISLAVGKIIDKFKMKKHYILTITDNSFVYERNNAIINNESIVDGLYIIRTSLDKDFMSSEDCLREYKKLIKVKSSFCSLKTTDLKIRPVGHYTEFRVRSHFFIRLLAYYVVWHMKWAWREIMFAAEHLAHKAVGDPVAPAKRSKEARENESRKLNRSGDKVFSFQVILQSLSTHIRVQECLKLKYGEPIKYYSTSKLTDFQEKALKLLQDIEVKV